MSTDLIALISKELMDHITADPDFVIDNLHEMSFFIQSTKGIDLINPENNVMLKLLQNAVEKAKVQQTAFETAPTSPKTCEEVPPVCDPVCEKGFQLPVY